MYDIKMLNKISQKGLSVFGKNYNCDVDIENPDAIIVRSASMHEMELPASLKAIARAGAGVNNIPLDKCSEKGIVVFNTPGANANAVKELVIAGLLLSSRKMAPALSWAQDLKGKGDEVGKLVEKGKSSFVGPEIKGKGLGVIGLGAIGVLVANAAVSLGMDVYGYDPYISVDAAWGLSRSVKHVTNLKDIYDNADYITVHVPFNKDTKDLINKTSISMMKDDVRILNFARGGLVNDDDIIEAVKSGKVAAYVTDFPDDKVLGIENIIAIPHLGASTPESEENCAYMAAQELKNFLESGNINNSVNMPNLEIARAGDVRICVIHKNVPAMLTQITKTPSSQDINIENMMSKSKGDYAYSILDIDTSDDSKIDAIVNELNAMDPVIKAWFIK